MTAQADAAPGRPDAPILLLTKLHPPIVPAQTVARERLFARLRDGRGRRLSLVACPAGFGKSTLLATCRSIRWKFLNATTERASDEPRHLHA